MRIKSIASLLAVSALATASAVVFAAEPTPKTQGTMGSEGYETPTDVHTATVGTQDDADAVLKDIHHSNLMEIEMGKLAKKQGQAAAIKNFGDKLVKDHRDADTKVLALAKTRNTDLSQQKASMEGEMAQLKALKGNAFDLAFAQAMVEDHRVAIESLQAAQPKLAGTPTGDLVDQVLPVIQEHQQIAVDLVRQCSINAKS